MRSSRVPLRPVLKAFDEAEFGVKNILNLRESLPTAADARYRAEAWLRERPTKEEPSDPQVLAALESPTLALLRRLAVRSLESLGVREPDKFVEAEMLTKFNSLAAGIPSGEGSEAKLREAISAVLEQLDE